MTESCSSSEMDVSSASLGKPEKICLVCGDKALGYNFNAVSCESCKAFFRRNAHKTIRGRCEGRCEVTVESRSFCKRCRLAKCFTVGMRKDMILNEEQKKQRKQKIITNKLRRQGQLPQGNILPDGTAPYDTHPPHHYLKPESTADLAMMELTGAGKHGRDYLQQGPHHPLAGHRMGRYPYPPQELYNMGHGYSPNLGKSVPAASTPSSSAYGAGPGFQTSSMLPLSPTSSSPSLLQHEKYYSNQHHHRRHHYQQQQQQHLYHNHQHRRPQQQQHLSHQDGQFYSTRPLVAMKQERFGHLDQGNQICREKKEASSSSLRPHVESQIPGVQLVHIKQEVPDSISDSPEASSTHSPPMTKVPQQPLAASLHSQSPLFPPGEASHADHVSRSSSCYSQATDSSYIGKTSGYVVDNAQKSTPPGPISPTSSTSPNLNSGYASSHPKEASSPSTLSPADNPNVGTSVPTSVNKDKGTFPKAGKERSASCQIMPWSDSQDLVNEAIENIGFEGARDVREMMQAMESGTFFDGNRSVRTIPTTPEEFVNTAELFVKKVIKFAKNLTSFKSLLRCDQIGLLKSSVVDIMMLRSAINYDPFTETWNLNSKGCMSKGANQAAGARISAEILKSGTEDTKKLFVKYSKFIKSLMSTVHGDRVILEFLILISLFSADRLPLEQHDKIQAIQEHYAYLLQCYLSHRFDGEETLFARIILKLADLRDINEIHSDMLLHMKVDELDPLLVEIFELPIVSESREDEGKNQDKKQKSLPTADNEKAKGDVTIRADSNFSEEKVQRSNCVTTSKHSPQGMLSSIDGSAGPNLSPGEMHQQQRQPIAGFVSIQTTSALPPSSNNSNHREMVPVGVGEHRSPRAHPVVLEKQASWGQTSSSLSPTSTQLSPSLCQSPAGNSQFSPPPELSKLRLNSFSGSIADNEKVSPSLLSPETHISLSSSSLDTSTVVGSGNSILDPFTPSLSKYPCRKQSPKLTRSPSVDFYSPSQMGMEF